MLQGLPQEALGANQSSHSLESVVEYRLPSVEEAPWQNNYRLGLGVHAISGDLRSPAVTVPVNEQGGSTHETSYYTTHTCTDSIKKHVSRKMDASGGLNFGTSPHQQLQISGQLATNKYLQSSSTSFSFQIVWEFEQKPTHKQSQNFSLVSPHVREEGAEFTETYGDYFISDATLLSRFEAVVVFCYDTATQRDETLRGFSVQAGGVMERTSVKISQVLQFSKDIQTAFKDRNVVAYVHMIGINNNRDSSSGLREISDLQSLDPVLERLSWFLNSNNRMAEPVLAHLSHYTNVPELATRRIRGNVPYDGSAFKALKQICDLFYDCNVMSEILEIPDKQQKDEIEELERRHSRLALLQNRLFRDNMIERLKSIKERLSLDSNIQNFFTKERESCSSGGTIAKDYDVGSTTDASFSVTEYRLKKGHVPRRLGIKHLWGPTERTVTVQDFALVKQAKGAEIAPPNATARVVGWHMSVDSPSEWKIRPEKAMFRSLNDVQFDLYSGKLLGRKWDVRIFVACDPYLDMLVAEMR